MDREELSIECFATYYSAGLNRSMARERIVTIVLVAFISAVAAFGFIFGVWTRILQYF